MSKTLSPEEASVLTRLYADRDGLLKALNDIERRLAIHKNIMDNAHFYFDYKVEEKEKLAIDTLQISLESILESIRVIDQQINIIIQ